MFDDLRVRQRYATRTELGRAVHQRPTADWLSDAECAELAQLRHPERREAWLAGRLLSKQLIAAESGTAESDGRSIEVRSRDVHGKGTRPTISIGGSLREDWSLSISHSDTAVFVVLSTAANLSVGIDLAPMTTYPSGFLKVWFTPREQQQVRTAGSRRAAEVWAVKEAVYKASNRGETFAPRRIEVLAGPRGRFLCRNAGTTTSLSCEIRVKRIGQDIAAIALAKPWETHDD